MSKIQGKNFVFTGRLVSYAREEAICRVRDKGGSTQSMVNEKTDYLVIGGFQINMFDLDYFSFKQRRAQELIAKGVPIQLIDEEQFLDLINV